jgi:hypothetical protein
MRDKEKFDNPISSPVAVPFGTTAKKQQVFSAA